MQAAQINETVSTCRFAQRMMHVAVDAQRNFGGLSSVHGNFMKLDPLMQQYLEVRKLPIRSLAQPENDKAYIDINR